MHISSSPARPARSALIVAAVLTTSLIFPLSITGPAAALPSLSAQLGGGALLPWIVTAYNATFAASLFLGGVLADRFGHRRVYTLGVALFAIAAVMLTVFSAPAILVAARGLAGVGAAAATTGGTALLSAAVRPQRRTRVFGAIGTIMGCGLAFGPLLSGLLIERFGWRAVFAVPAVLAALALAALAAAPRDPVGGTLRPPRPPRALGTARSPMTAPLLFTATFLTLTVGVGEIAGRGIGHPVVLTALACALVSGCALFGVTEVGSRRSSSAEAPAPLVPRELRRDRRFLALVIAAGALMAVFVPLVVFLPLVLAERGGPQATVAVLFLTVPMVVLPSIGGWISQRISVVTMSGVGLAAAALGLCATAVVLGGEAPIFALAPGLVAIGSAVGVTSGILDGAALATAPEDVSARAAGVLNTARLSSETLSLAVTSALVLGAAVSHAAALAPVAGGLAALALVAATAVMLLGRGHRGKG